MSICPSGLSQQALSELSSLGHSPTSPLLAVSGGVDSMVLLDLFARNRDCFPGGLAVGHVDHGLRSDSSKDAELVRDICQKLDLPFFLEVLSPKPPQENLEAWARTERYRALADISKREERDIVLTAHHQDDQAETILFRVLTGRNSAPMPRYCPRRRLYRPLLSVSREDIEQYACENDVAFREDSSNSDLNRSRNFLRHDLLPRIRESLNPGIDRSLVMLRDEKAATEQYFREAAAETLKGIGGQLGLAKLTELPEPLDVFCLLELGHSQVGPVIDTVSRKKLRQLASFIGQDLGQGLRVSLNSEGFIKFSAS